MTTEKSLIRSLALTAVTTLVATLAACGGGGGDAASTASDNGADPIDKYMGTFVGTCGTAPRVQDANTGAQVYARLSRTLATKVSSIRATGTVQMQYFDASDCSGSARATIDFTTPDNFLNVDGSEVIGGQTVDKFTAGMGVYFPGITFGTSFTLNGLTFQNAPYNSQTPTTDKDIGTVDASGRLFDGNLTQPLDADGYPTVLNTTASAQKS